MIEGVSTLDRSTIAPAEDSTVIRRADLPSHMPTMRRAGGGILQQSSLVMSNNVSVFAVENAASSISELLSSYLNL